ncbi:non-homologous end joining protein Ku [Streptomyces sp. 7N604]|uniref:non-homologous end joining protein Ku n=1 Tax=Streptomyces sp. 7N604 TaxID=3457415 RepID=UPI003FD10C11
MPRSLWKGAISFGLVTIPIQVVGATESHDITLHRVHKADNGRVRNRRVCELDGQEIPLEDIVSAYPVGRDQVVPLTDEDFDQLPIPTAKTFEIIAFMSAETIDPLQLDKAYYLVADGTAAAKPYVLLRDALERSGKVAVGKVALRGRESLAAIRIHQGALTMHTMLWPDEIRPHEGMAPEQDVKLSNQELQAALALMDTMDEVPEDALHDEYTRALEEVVTAKLEHRPVPKAEEPAEKAPRVVDLMAALEKSVSEQRAARGGQPKETGAKKSAAKKVAKKSSSKSRKRA